MATITEDYVSFETAKLLKEKGFDVYGDGSFGSEIKIWMEYSPFGKIRDVSSSRPSIKGYPSPTLQMAMKWLREVHKLHIELNWNYANQQYSFQIWKIGKSHPEIYSLDLWHDNHEYAGEWNYEQACEAAIKYCLEHLI